MQRMDSKHFDQLVQDAVSQLPAEFAGHLDNVSIAVRDLATPDQLEHAQVRDPHQVLGLYEGVPLTERDRGYFGVLPDRITIFRIPIEAVCHSDEEIKAQVRRTVMHELGHYFGMSDKRLWDDGAY